MQKPIHPKISIVLPVYNGARYIEDCLQSIHHQTFTDYELLIGDDGSTDETPSIIDRHSDARWTYVRRAKNLGLFGNLNSLLISARAPLIRFLCQDDLLEPDCLAEEVAFFKAHPDVGMFFCKAKVIDDKGEIVGRWQIDDVPTIMPPHTSLQYFYYYGCLPGNLSTVCVSQTTLKKMGLFDESFKVAGDFELWVRICQQADLGVLHRHLIKLRTHPGQLSQSSTSYLAHVLETRRIRATILPILPEEIRSTASRYTLMRQNVFDVHHALRCLLEGRPGASAKIMRAMGSHDLAVGLCFWLVSANNRLFQPTPVFTTD